MFELHKNEESFWFSLPRKNKKKKQSFYYYYWKSIWYASAEKKKKNSFLFVLFLSHSIFFFLNIAKIIFTAAQKSTHHTTPSKIYKAKMCIQIHAVYIAIIYEASQVCWQAYIIHKYQSYKASHLRWSKAKWEVKRKKKHILCIQSIHTILVTYTQFYNLYLTQVISTIHSYCIRWKH